MVSLLNRCLFVTLIIGLGAWRALRGIPSAFLAEPVTAIMSIVFCAFPGMRPIAVLLSKSRVA